MKNVKIFSYQLEHKEHKFDYFSLLDNTIVNSTYNNVQQEEKISVLKIRPSNDKDANENEESEDDTQESLQETYYYSAFRPLKAFVTQCAVTSQSLFLDSSDTNIQIKYVLEIFNLPERYQTIYFYRFGPNATTKLIENFESIGCICNPVNDSLLCVKKKNDNTDIIFEKDDNVDKIIEKCISKIIYDYLYQKEPKIRPVISSNIFSTRYVNIRKIFTNTDMTTLVTMRLLRKILSIEHEFDAFVCASITGACIASYLSVYIKKPILFLRNIGPDITTQDELIVERLYPQKKYVYIFDFMCLGTELQRTKLVCKLRKAKIIKSFGVAHYKRPYQATEKDVDTLLDINAFNSDYYKCHVDEEELKRLYSTSEEKK